LRISLGGEYSICGCQGSSCLVLLSSYTCRNNPPLALIGIWEFVWISILSEMYSCLLVGESDGVITLSYRFLLDFEWLLAGIKNSVCKKPSFSLVTKWEFSSFLVTYSLPSFSVFLLDPKFLGANFDLLTISGCISPGVIEFLL